MHFSFRRHISGLIEPRIMTLCRIKWQQFRFSCLFIRCFQIGLVRGIFAACQLFLIRIFVLEEIFLLSSHPFSHDSKLTVGKFRQRFYSSWQLTQDPPPPISAPYSFSRANCTNALNEKSDDAICQWNKMKCAIFVLGRAQMRWAQRWWIFVLWCIMKPRWLR